MWKHASGLALLARQVLSDDGSRRARIQASLQTGQELLVVLILGLQRGIHERPSGVAAHLVQVDQPALFVACNPAPCETEQVGPFQPDRHDV